MKYRREIDGLRALAIIPVILFHAGFSAFRGGFIGVDIFFVISGYLITTILTSEKHLGKYSIVTFYERRARRILPALYFMMALVIPVAWVYLLPSYMESFARSIAAVPLFSSNILFSVKHGYFETGADLKPLLHTWSLGVEEQFYVLFPILLSVLWKYAQRWIGIWLLLIALLSLALAQWGAHSFPTQAYYLLPTRAWEILIGSMLAIHNLSQTELDQIKLLRGQLLSALGFVLILISIFSFDEATPYPSIYTLCPTIGAALIIQFATKETWVGKLLGLQVLVGIGLISYSVYLWHQPLFAFARHLQMNEPSRSEFMLVIALSILMGYLSWRFVEAPFRRKDWIGRNQIFQFAIVGAAFFILVGVLGQLSHGVAFRFSEKVNAVLRTPDLHRLQRDDGCNLEQNESHLPKCVKGDKAVKPKYAVIGDSHASVLIQDLADSFSMEHKSFVQYTKNGCPFVIGLRKMPSESCDAYHLSLLDDLAMQDFETLIIYSRWSLYLSEENYDNGEGGVEIRESEQYTAGDLDFSTPFKERKEKILTSMDSTLRRVINSGKKIILVYPTPEYAWDVPTRYAKLLLRDGNEAKDVFISARRYRERHADVIQLFDALGEKPNLIRIKPEAIFCNTYQRDRCVATSNGVLFYFDDDHLSNDGAQFIVEKIMLSIKKSDE